MSSVFLSDEWFVEQDKAKSSIKGLEMNEKLSALVANLIMDVDGESFEACFRGGFLEKGHAEDAQATLNIPANIAYKALVLGDTSQAVGALMSGKIKIDGNKMMLMSLANSKPTETQKQFMAKLEEVTVL